MRITATPEQIMMVVPVLAGLYCAACNRAVIWKNKKTIFHVILVVSSVLSVAGILEGRIQIRAAERMALDEAQKQEEMEHVAAAREKNRLARNPRGTDTELIECEDPKQFNLPGEWWNLYQSVKETTYWEAKLTGIESFARHYGVADVEPLPIVGFNLILKQLDVKDSNSRTRKHIYRAKAALEPYISPFDAQPNCFVKKKSQEQN